MSTISETIYQTESHPGQSTVESRVGEKYKGDGFYGRTDGLHTVQWTITDFKGTVSVQATLAVNPIEEDWFTVSLGKGDQYAVDTTGLVSKISINSVTYSDSTDGSFSYNFVGNYVWVRAKIDNWTRGSINSIKLSH
jgi:hypothetical protein